MKSYTGAFKRTGIQTKFSTEAISTACFLLRYFTPFRPVAGEEAKAESMAMKSTATLFCTALVWTFLPGLVLAETPSPLPEMAKAQKQAEQRQMMQRMQKKKAAAEAARIPTTTSIYDPSGGEMGRNMRRFDQPLCMNWRGGPKGTLVPSDRTPPAVPPMPGMHGMVGLGFSGACDRGEAFLSFSNRGENAFVRGMVYSENKSGYTAPDGDFVETSSDRLAYSFGAGVFRPDGSFLSLDLRRMERDKVRFAGAPIDTTNLDVSRADLAGKLVFDTGVFNQLRFSARLMDIDKTNDNFTYRTPPMQVEVQVERKTTDIGVALDGGGGGFKWTLGVGYASDERDATRYMGPALVSQSPNFADASVAITSLNADGTWALSPDRRVKAGMRIDYVDASLGGMDRTVAMPTPTPRQVFGATYGYTGSGRESETNISGSVRFEQDMADKMGMFFVGLSREVRSANPRERYFTSISGAPFNMWIGNPGLKAEKHYMLEAGAGWKGGPWELAGRVYTDHVDDFILWDRARGQAGVVATDNRNIFRNVDALIGGIEGSVKYKIGNGFWTGADIWLTRGENLTDDRPIGQIPPAEAALKLGWANKKFSVETRLRLVSKSTRLDDNYLTGSGVDGNGMGGALGGGYGLVDVLATWKPRPNMMVNMGIENLLDKSYTPLIERDDIYNPGRFNPTGSGRSLWVSATFKF